MTRRSIPLNDQHYWDGWLETKRKVHGEKFDPAELNAAIHFMPYLHRDQRIRVKGPMGIRTGTVGVTTGWRPAFLLMAQTSAHGSSDVLGPKDRIVAVQIGRVYVEVA